MKTVFKLNRFPNDFQLRIVFPAALSLAGPYRPKGRCFDKHLLLRFTE